MSKELINKVNNYIQENNESVTSVAQKIGIGRSALSQYLNEKYASDPTNIENKITAFLESEGIFIAVHDEVAATQLAAKVDRSFYRSKDANNIMAVAAACQDEMLLGCIVGKSGYGKTMTLKKYSLLDKVLYIECDSMMRAKDLLYAIEHALGLPRGRGTISDRANDIKKFFNVNRGYLLIIDEADKLINKDTTNKLEMLRNIYDQADVGLLVVGEEILEMAIKQYDTRFANRIDQYYRLKGLGRDEVMEYLGDLDITDKAKEELVVRATNSNNGCFRLLDRTLRNVLRLHDGKKNITVDTIASASAMMLL